MLGEVRFNFKFVHQVITNVFHLNGQKLLFIIATL